MRKKCCTIVLPSLAMIVGFIFIMVSLQGCEPLRKKFTRHKKGEAQQQEYEPILDPIDYPAKVYDPQADYTYRYSLFRVWEKELTAGIQDRVSAKRLQYLVSNILVQLEEMSKLVTDDKKPALASATQNFQTLLQTVAQPTQFYNLRDVGIEVERAARPILNDYRPQLMEGKIISATP